MSDIVLSMATMPSRKKRLLENIPSLVNGGQTYDGFTKFYINVSDDLEDDDYEFYEKLKDIDDRIEIVRCDGKWRSCNKLIPTLKSNADDAIITVDDDIFYPRESLERLVNEYEKNKDCIIAHEINPVILSDDGLVTYLNTFDVKLKQREYGKYLTDCALFPPHVFDGTDVFNYDKMMELTDGCHDEIWFWVNSTLNKVQVIGLNYVLTFEGEVKSEWHDDEFRLCNINSDASNIRIYNHRINKLYGKELYDIISNFKVEINVTCDNIYQAIEQYDYIIYLYSGRAAFNLNSLTKAYCKMFINRITKNKMIRY